MTAHRSVVNTKTGDNAELYCEFETSTDKNRVVWRKDQKELQVGGPHEQRSKYSMIYKQKTPSKNVSILVISNVKPKDLGSYECQVENTIGAENVSIELTNVPEPPQLHNVEYDDQFVITHWHIRSLQPLEEVMLNYQLKGVSNCIAVLLEIAFAQKILLSIFWTKFGLGTFQTILDFFSKKMSSDKMCPSGVLTHRKSHGRMFLPETHTNQI